MNNSYERPKSKLSVFMEMADGHGETVSLFLHHGDKLINLLNGSSAFLEVENSAGETVFIARSSIWRLTPTEGEKTAKREKAGPMGGETWRHHSEDPYILLNIRAEATDDQVRDAYHAMARAYHPDKLIGLDLPPSMIEHGSTIFQKVNAAYKGIMEQRRKTTAA